MTLTQYEEGLPVHVAYKTMEVKVPLAKVLSDLGLRQFHIAETEKYAHVTFFFNGRHRGAVPRRGPRAGALAQSGHLRPQAGDERARHHR